jgi:hypothetical protein
LDPCEGGEVSHLLGVGLRAIQLDAEALDEIKAGNRKRAEVKPGDLEGVGFEE